MVARARELRTGAALTKVAFWLCWSGAPPRMLPGWHLLKSLDRKGERGHELAMQDKALEFEKLRGASRMAEISANAPTVLSTHLFMALYCAAKAAAFLAALNAGAGWGAAVLAAWTDAGHARGGGVTVGLIWRGCAQWQPWPRSAGRHSHMHRLRFG